MATPEEMFASMVRNMKEKTGKSLPEWVGVAAASGYEKHGQIVKFLKSEQGLTHGYANLVAHQLLKGDQPAAAPEQDLVAVQYAGPKAGLRGIYDQIIERVCAFGEDVAVAPKKAYVSLRRSKQFALIQPSTKTRVDVGINFKGHETGARLEASGSFNSMVSHRVRLSDINQVDDELIGWLREAYDAS